MIVVITASRGWVPFLPLLNMPWTVLSPLPTALHFKIMEVTVMRSPAPRVVLGGWAVCKMTSVKHKCLCAHLCSLRRLQPGIGLREAPSAASCTHNQALYFSGCPQAVDQAYDSKISYLSRHVTWPWNADVAEPDVIVFSRNKNIKTSLKSVK